jgi:hypothetical protein
MAYLLDAGAASRADRRAALAGAVVAGESLIFAANGFRVPRRQFLRCAANKAATRRRPS